MTPERFVALLGLIATAALVTATSACGQSSSGGDARATSCPNVLPSGCPSAPSYSKDIAPLVTASCMPCHEAGGQEATKDLSTHAGLTKYGSTVVFQLNSCVMPPATAPASNQLTTAGRTELLQWFVCGSPNN